MKIKLTTSRSGIGFSQNVDDEIEVTDAEGKRMIEAGQAIPVKRSKPVEKATKK